MIEYTQDIPRGDAEMTAEVIDHVVAHLSAVAAEDDDPETNGDDVVVTVLDHPDDPSMVRIVGTLDAEPSAPYLQPDYDPWAGVDHDFFAEAIEAAIADEQEVRDGQA